MPLSKHYGGHGDEVMASMQKTYKNPKKAKQVFYATENAEKNRGVKFSGHGGGKVKPTSTHKRA